MIAPNEEIKAGANAPLYQLKIKLAGSKPPIWRRVVVRANLRLDRLHDAIQIVMPWTNSHLHQFIVGETCYGQTGPEFDEWDTGTLDEKKHQLAHLVSAAKAKFIYEYDFGDGWEHEVTLEKILPPDKSFKHPVCLGGARACPPDDCGGIFGYEMLLETLANPKHPEHKNIKEWIGGKWDAEAFDLDRTNAGLKRLKA